MRLWTWVSFQLCWCFNFPSPPSQVHHALGELCMCWFGTGQLRWVIWLWVQAQGPVVQRWTTLSSSWPGKASLFHPCWPWILASFLPSRARWAEPGLSHTWSDQQKPGSRAETLQLRGRGEMQSSGVGPCFCLWRASGTAGQQSSQAFCRNSQKLEQVSLSGVWCCRKMTKLSCTHLIWLKAWTSPDTVQLLSPQDHTLVGISL